MLFFYNRVKEVF